MIVALVSHDGGRCHRLRESILRHITHDVLVVGISSDVLYPVSETRRLAAAIPGGRFAVLDSPHGHDAFLIETGPVAEAIAAALDRAAVREC